jgi:hypothetical protein
VLGAVLAGGAKPAMEMLVLTAIARLVLHFRVSLPGSPVSHLLVLPFRDLLSVSLWLWGFATRRVQWRDDRYHVHRDGSVQLVARV